MEERGSLQRSIIILYLQIICTFTIQNHLYSSTWVKALHKDWSYLSSALLAVATLWLSTRLRPSMVKLSLDRDRVPVPRATTSPTASPVTMQIPETLAIHWSNLTFSNYCTIAVVSFEVWFTSSDNKCSKMKFLLEKFWHHLENFMGMFKTSTCHFILYGQWNSLTSDYLIYKLYCLKVWNQSKWPEHSILV